MKNQEEKELKPSVRRKLKEANIRLIGINGGIFACNQCNSIWAVNSLFGGRMPNNWWKCENGCNNKYFMKYDIMKGTIKSNDKKQN